MKPFNHYNTTIKFPNKSNFVVNREVTFKNQVKLIEFFDEDSFNEALKLYYDDQNKLYSEFVSDLYDDLGITGNPKADLLYEIAYDKAHSGGCEEVYYMAQSLVGLIK